MIREAVATQAAPAAIGPYSQAMTLRSAAGDRGMEMIFASGQLGLNPDTGKLQEGIEAQTRQALANLAAVLEAAGAGMDDVVKTTIFLVDLGEFATVNAIYGTAFGDAPPARSTVQVAALPLGGFVEIEAIAVIRS